MDSKYALLNPSTHIGAAHRRVHRGNVSWGPLILSISRNKLNFFAMWQELRKPRRLKDCVRIVYSSHQLPEYRKMKQNTGPRCSSMHEMLLVTFKVGL